MRLSVFVSFVELYVLLKKIPQNLLTNWPKLIILKILND